MGGLIIGEGGGGGGAYIRTTFDISDNIYSTCIL